MKQTFFTPTIPVPELHLQLMRWFSSSQGKKLLELETTCANQLMKKMYGHYLVEAGFPGNIQCNGIRFPITLGGGGSSISRVLGAATQMPFQTDSIDAVLLAHALDFSADPHQVLRETDRILIPEGRVIIFGFNPYSIWGLRRLARTRGEEIPWGASFISLSRVVDWLILLGFTIEIEQRLMFTPPLNAVKWIHGIGLLEKIGKRLWSPLSAVYVIKAVKRVYTPTPIMPSWKLKHIISSPMAEPTTRNTINSPQKRKNNRV